MENRFTISKETSKLLSIYREINEVSKNLFYYFVEYEASGDPEKGDEYFSPYNEKLDEVRKAVKKLIDIRIEDTLLEGDGDEI